MTRPPDARRVTSVRRVVCAAVALVLLGALPSSAALSDLDLRNYVGTAIVGATKIAAAGDVNGDGIPDLLVALGRDSPDPVRGRSWVIFGSRPMPPRIVLEDLGDRGFVIEGAQVGDDASSVAPAGDVNGDGLDDIIVGAAGAHLDGGRLSAENGRAYIVFGKTTTDPVELADFDLGAQGMQGFRIDGPPYRALAGRVVAGLGDLNGDGLADIAIGAPFGGAVYVVFGKRDPSPVALSTFYLGTQGPLGYRIRTPSVESDALQTLAGPGDVNGDGIPDILIGVIPSYGSKGSAYVVFGKPDPLDQDVRDLGDGGFRVRGPKRDSWFGYALAGAGDVNGDGLADIIIGSPTQSCCPRAAYVIFGKADPDMVTIKRAAEAPRRVGRYGFEIRSPRFLDSVGYSVSGAGDVNGDGLADVLVGAPLANPKGRLYAGIGYVVYGKKGNRYIDLGRLGHRGQRVIGARARDYLAGSVAGVGDVSGDGVPDMLMAVPGRANRRYIMLIHGQR